MPGSRPSGGRIFVLDLSGGRVFSLNPDGSDPKTLVTGCRLPDGLAVDLTAGYIYWTNMGVPHKNDGSIERADLDGGNRRFIVPEGGTFTPKQLHLEKQGGKLYWSDREGMRVMRANLAGSQVETLIQTGEGEGDRHAAMIPYTIIKEVNPDEVKGSAIGAINFLTFAVTAAIGPIFAGQFGKTLGARTIDAGTHFRHAGLFWTGILIAAVVVGSLLRETGHGHPTPAA